MVFLPSDVLLLIFDYVTVKTDLTAICEVSKGYHELALPLLCREVCLTVWILQLPKLKRFLQWNSAGTNAHLRHTRSLIIERSAPPSEPRLEPTQQLVPDDLNEEEHYKYYDEVARLLFETLMIFPENCLHTFEFISRNSISLAMLQVLNTRQKCLKRMKFTWGSDWDQEPKSQRPCGEALPLFDGLLALDIHLKASELIRSSTDMEMLVEAFFASNANLERLHVGAGTNLEDSDLEEFDVESIPDSFAKALFAAARARPITFPKLKEFSISNMEFSSEYTRYYHQFIPFEKLQRLSIFSDGYDYSLVNYLDDVFPDDQLNLTHLKIDIQTDDAVPLLGPCKPLTSLHIITNLIDFENFMTGLRKHGEALRTLAIAQSITHYVISPPTVTSIEEEDFKELCRICHNLNFLGIEVSHEQVQSTHWDMDCELGQRLKALASIRGLRLIHFRVSQMSPYGYYYMEPRKKHAQTSIEMEGFARRVFQFMDAHGACMHLRSIVVGSHYFDNEKYCGGQKCYPQHCFVKEYLSDETGVLKVAAKQVPAYRIRDMEPDCDLFEFDAKANWMVPCQVDFDSEYRQKFIKLLLRSIGYISSYRQQHLTAHKLTSHMLQGSHLLPRGSTI